MPNHELQAIITHLKKRFLDDYQQQSYDIYIEPHGGYCAEETAERCFPILKQLQDDIEQNQQLSFLILGNPGLGKTLLSQQIAKQAWDKLEAKKFIPLWIWLPSIPKESITTSLLTHFLKTQGGLSKQQIDKLQQSCQKGDCRLLLIIDGLDEIPLPEQNFYASNHWWQAGGWPHVTVLTFTRPEIFTSYNRESNYHELFQVNSSTTIQYAREYYLQPFDNKQLQTYISRFHEKQTTTFGDWPVSRYQGLIEKHFFLKDLATNPFVLSILLPVLPSLVDANPSLEGLTREKVYRQFTHFWLSRQAQRLYQNQASRELLRAYLIGKNNNIDFTVLITDCLMHYSQNLARLALNLGQGKLDVLLTEEDTATAELISQETDQYRLNGNPTSELIKLIRSGSLLKCQDGSFRFLHKTLVEFFAASELFQGAYASLQAYLDKNPQAGLEQFSLNEQLLTKEPQTLGLLADLVKTDPKFKEILYQVIEFSKVEPYVSTAAANAVTALNMAGENFSFQKWSGINIPGADLSGAILAEADLSEANLTRVRLNNALLRGANLQRACLLDLEWGELPAIENEHKPTCVTFDANNNSLWVGTSSGIITQYDSVGNKQRTFKAGYAGALEEEFPHDTVVGRVTSKTMTALAGPDYQQISRIVVSKYGSYIAVTEMTRTQHKTPLIERYFLGPKCHSFILIYNLKSQQPDIIFTNSNNNSDVFDRKLDERRYRVIDFSISHKTDNKKYLLLIDDQGYYTVVDLENKQRVLQNKINYAVDLFGSQISKNTEHLALYTQESGVEKKIVIYRIDENYNLTNRRSFAFADVRHFIFSENSDQLLLVMPNCLKIIPVVSNAQIVTLEVTLNDYKTVVLYRNKIVAHFNDNSLRVLTINESRYPSAKNFSIENNKFLDSVNPQQSISVSSQNFYICNNNSIKILPTQLDDSVSHNFRLSTLNNEIVFNDGLTSCSKLDSLPSFGERKILHANYALMTETSPDKKDQLIHIFQGNDKLFTSRVKAANFITSKVHVDLLLEHYGYCTSHDGQYLIIYGLGCQGDPPEKTVNLSKGMLKNNGLFLSALGKMLGMLKLFDFTVYNLVNRKLIIHNYSDDNGLLVTIFSLDFKWLVLANNKVTIFDLSSGKIIQQYAGFSNYVSSLALSPNKQWLAVVDDENILSLWNTSTQKQVCRIDSFQESINQVAFSSDNNFIQLTTSRGEMILKIEKQPSEEMITRLYIYTYKGKLSLDCTGMNIQDTYGLSDHNNRLLIQKNAVGKPHTKSEAIANATFNQVATTRSYTALTANFTFIKPIIDHPDAKSIIDKHLPLDYNNWVVALLRKSNHKHSEHAFLLLEGMDAFGRALYVRLHIATQHGNQKSEEGYGWVRIEQHAELKLENREAVLTAKLGDVSNMVGHAWSVSRQQARQLVQAVITEKERITQVKGKPIEGVIPYSLTGEDSIFSASGHNCYSWARSHLLQLNNPRIKKDLPIKWTDYFAADPRIHLSVNPDGRKTNAATISACSVM